MVVTVPPTVETVLAEAALEQNSTVAAASPNDKDKKNLE